jgi:hypothetical protein
MEMEITLGRPTGATNIPITFPGPEPRKFTAEPFDVPYQSVLSLSSILQRAESFAESPDFGVRFLTTELLRRVELVPELREPIKDLSIIEKHKDTFDLLLTFLLPPGSRETEFFKISRPFRFDPVYVSPAMQDLMSMQDAVFSFGDGLEKVQARHLITVGCEILKRFYNVDIDVKPSSMLIVPDQETGLNQYYKPTMDESYLEIVAIGELPKLSPKQIQFLLQNIEDTKLWLELLPPDKFEFHGIHIAHLSKVTEEESLSQLKHRLISRNAILDIDRVTELANLIRTHFGNPYLHLGLTAIDFPTDRAVDHEYRIRFSFLHDQVGKLTDKEFKGSIYDKAFQSREVVIIDDLTAIKKKTKLERLLIKRDIKSILIAPLLDQQQNVIGMVELGSPKAYGINAFMGLKFREILNLFRTAVERSREYIDNRIEAIMREQYTSLHSSVEWRFTEAAYNILERQEAGEQDQPETISFKAVYPLYGQADIVGSSRLRNAAIYQDLFDNMRGGRFFLNRAEALVDFPLIQQVILRMDSHLKITVDEFDNSHEILFGEFIQQHLSPLIRQLGGQHPGLTDLSNKYFAKLDPDLKLFYRVRRDYEQSVTTLNRELSKFFSERDQSAQVTLPHYYEKYKTDGVEYEIYAGQSLLKNQVFSEVHLRNLRLSQLIDMCEATRLVKRISKNLPMPLRTAQLIFAYTSPLDIKFRMDEKRFDVDGDYNVRYEILKKRIDKATIRQGKERLTLAGQISIVYLQDRDKEEYMGYLNYLDEAGYIDGEIEDWVLDPLQSVNGLRGLRFRVKV